jgi:CO/xanthine dehydrogenase Mo-binding subunit
MIYKLKSGVKKDGTLMAITRRGYCRGGAYCSYGPTVIAAGIMRFMMVYRLKNIRLFGSRVYTNNPISGAIRGFGGVQSGFAIESHMDMLARGIGMDPAEFRLKNATDPNTTTINKMILSSNGLKDCIRKAVEISGWKEKYGVKKETAPGVFRGIGLAIAADVMGSKMYKSHESAGAIIKVEEDGSVYLFTGAADTGQGSDTAMAQIAAHELGVAYERIRVKAADTEITPFDTGSFASRVTFISGNATKNAATDAKRQILEVVAQELKFDIQDLDIKDEQVVNNKSGKPVLSFDQAVVLVLFFHLRPAHHRPG